QTGQHAYPHLCEFAFAFYDRASLRGLYRDIPLDARLLLVGQDAEPGRGKVQGVGWLHREYPICSWNVAIVTVGRNPTLYLNYRGTTKTNWSSSAPVFNAASLNAIRGGRHTGGD